MSETEHNPYATPDSALVAETGFAGYAGFWKRFFAFLIDWLLLTLAFSVFGLLTGGELFTIIDEARWDSVSAVVGIAIPWLYYAWFESSEQQATFGKLALNIQVTDLEGRRVSFLRASVRHFSKILSSMLLLIGYLMIPFTSRKQGLHDLIAGCLVVNRV
jgi:uncharacterized RDD family membrane protein YckC